LHLNNKYMLYCVTAFISTYYYDALRIRNVCGNHTRALFSHAGIRFYGYTIEV